MCFRDQVFVGEQVTYLTSVIFVECSDEISRESAAGCGSVMITTLRCLTSTLSQSISRTISEITSHQPVISQFE